MKIECPSCHLTGNVNPVDIPDEGRNFQCPRCKTAFFIDKPAPGVDGDCLMSICPVCQYSTFTDEMFAVCPKCGTRGTDYRRMLVEKAGGKKAKRAPIVDLPEEPPVALDREQMQREYELLTRSHRNPDFEAPVPDKKVKKPPLPPPLMLTGWAAVAAGALFLCYGLAGLSDYYGKDWQAILSVPLLEPVSRTQIFFRLGFFPWLRTLYGIGFILAATRFLALWPGAPRLLKGLSWGGAALILFQEIILTVNRILATSGSPPPIFYLDCFIGFLVKVVLWSILFLAVVWLLGREETIREFNDVLQRPDDDPVPY